MLLLKGSCDSEEGGGGRWRSIRRDRLLGMIKALIISVCSLGIVLFSTSDHLFIRPGFCSFGQQKHKPSETELWDVCRVEYEPGIQTACYGCTSALANVMGFSSDIGTGE